VRELGVRNGDWLKNAETINTIPVCQKWRIDHCKEKWDRMVRKIKGYKMRIDKRYNLTIT